MSLKFFADHCVPKQIVDALQDEGHPVLKLRDFIPKDSPDRKVIAKAQELDCILLSFNGDFADILTYPPANFKGIICLQVKNHPEIIPSIIIKLKQYLSFYPEMSHYVGKLLLIEAKGIRSRT